MFTERRDRSPFIESSENSAQYLDSTIGSRFKKGQSAFQTHNSPKNNEHESKDSTVDKSIRSVFSTNFGPGLHLFKNTALVVSPPHSNLNHNKMVGNQPGPIIPQSSPSSSNKDLFKIQRSPDGKLNVVYNENVVSKEQQNKSGEGSNTQTSENRFQSHLPDGLLSKKDKLATSSPAVENAPAKGSGVIHFPTEEPDEIVHSIMPDISDCLETDVLKNNKSLCNRLRNYPEKDHLEQLIKKKFGNAESFFGEDFVVPQNINQRTNAPNEEYLCKSRVRVIYPQSGQNKDWDWIYIVNSPKYKQGIRIEECLEPYNACGEHTGLSLPNHYKATCEQNYIYRSLIAYSNDTIYSDSFRIPSCCKCVLRSF